MHLILCQVVVHLATIYPKVLLLVSVIQLLLLEDLVIKINQLEVAASLVVELPTIIIQVPLEEVAVSSGRTPSRMLQQILHSTEEEVVDLFLVVALEQEEVVSPLLLLAFSEAWVQPPPTIIIT